MTFAVPPIGRLRKSRAIEIPNRIDPVMINGRLRPFGFLVWSDQLPTIGSVTASQSTAIPEMTPAIAGAMPACVVKKKEKNEKKKL